jgi:hypothetical protein
MGEAWSDEFSLRYQSWPFIFINSLKHTVRVHERVHMGMHVLVLMSAVAHMEARCQCLPQLLSTLFLQAGLISEPADHQLTRQAT